VLLLLLVGSSAVIGAGVAAPAPRVLTLPPQRLAPPTIPRPPDPNLGYNCPVAAGSPCSSVPCVIFVRPAAPVPSRRQVPVRRPCEARPAPRALPVAVK
jgi:hypothetical protein